jgi:hypothetical protein
VTVIDIIFRCGELGVALSSKFLEFSSLLVGWARLEGVANEGEDGLF